MTKTVGITGANGFIARWVAERLRRGSDCQLLLLDRDAWRDDSRLTAFVTQCDTIVHLAGVNRGSNEEVETVNEWLAERLVAACDSAQASPSIIFSSTTKRVEDTPYGRGKRRAEEVLSAWVERTGGTVSSLVIPNVYGAGCSPHYNSVVATFCHQLTHDEEPRVIGNTELQLLWVGDLAQTIAKMASESVPEGYTQQHVAATDQLTVAELLSVLNGFRQSYFDRDVVPDLASPFRAKLYSTFLSYIEPDNHVHQPTLHADARGKLCEVIKTDTGGQVFFSTTAPGVTRGNHYHTRKVEWFCVVHGEALIRLRRLHDDVVHTFCVSGDTPKFVSIPVLHTHSIENTGSGELLTLFWTSELFDSDDPDTFHEDVLESTPAVAA